MVERFPAPDDGPLAAEPEQRAAGRPVVVTNPLSSQHAVLRQSVLGSVLEVLATNLRYGRDDVAIFEVGKGYGATGDRRPTSGGGWPSRSPGPPSRRPGTASAARTTSTTPRGSSRRSSIGSAMPRPPTRHSPTIRTSTRAGRRASTLAGQLVGRVGELHPATIEALDLRAERVVVAEVAIAGLAGGQLRDPIGATPSRHPGVERDLAVVVAESTSAATVEAAIRATADRCCARSSSSTSIAAGRSTDDDKSLAYRLTLRDDERTLTENEVDGAVAAVVAGLAGDLGARIRT